ncbi:MAG: hypothetical protein U9Q98_06400 [Bacteroidota bacterium]|nr:hypothetical protein [Bacteroidota bacterium]
MQVLIIPQIRKWFTTASLNYTPSATMLNIARFTVATPTVFNADRRMASFDELSGLKIYNNNRRKSGRGNDFFESAVVHSDRVLSDLMKIFYLDMANADSMRYYTVLTKQSGNSKLGIIPMLNALFDVLILESAECDECPRRYRVGLFFYIGSRAFKSYFSSNF